MSGQWPPEWGEPDWEDQDEDSTTAESGTAEAEHPEFSEVSAALAALPMPALPAVIEARITTALAAEADARAAGTAVVAEPAAHTLDTRSARPRVRHRRPRQQRYRLRPVAAAGSLLTALLLSGFGYLLAQGGSSAISTAASAPSAASSASGAMAAPEMGTQYSQALPSDLHSAADGERSLFVVTSSSSNYVRATLSTQLRRVLASAQSLANEKSQQPSAGVPAGGSSAPATVPSASGSGTAAAAAGTAGSGAAGAAALAPSPALVGCVLHVTGHVAPTLVEYAHFEGQPVFVIVVPTKAWIVGVGCTASDPRVITSVSLAG